MRIVDESIVLTSYMLTYHDMSTYRWINVHITDLQIRMLLLTSKQYPTLSPHCLCRATWEPQTWNEFSICIQIKWTSTKSSFCTNNFTVPKKSRYSFSSCFRASSCPVQKVFGWHLFSLLLLVIFKRDCSKLNCKVQHWSSASQLNFKELWAHTTLGFNSGQDCVTQFVFNRCGDIMIQWLYDDYDNVMKIRCCCCYLWRGVHSWSPSTVSSPLFGSRQVLIRPCYAFIRTFRHDQTVW